MLSVNAHDAPVEKRLKLSEEDAHILMLLPVLPRCLQALSADDFDFFQ